MNLKKKKITFPSCIPKTIHHPQLALISVGVTYRTLHFNWELSLYKRNVYKSQDREKMELQTITKSSTNEVVSLFNLTVQNWSGFRELMELGNSIYAKRISSMYRIKH